MTFLRNNTFWYAFYSKFGALSDFEKIISKNSYIFSEKKFFLTFWEFLLFESRSTANLLKFIEKK